MQESDREQVQGAASLRAAHRDHATHLRNVVRVCLEDRPYLSPARQGDALGVPTDSSTVACVFQAARAILPANLPAGTIRSEKSSSSFAASHAGTCPFRRPPLAWPCPARLRIAP